MPKLGRQSPKRDIELAEPRDGPTAEYLRHHTVTYRGDSPHTKRRFTRLEQLARLQHIRPEESEAGIRFAVDWLRYNGRTKSSLNILVGKSAGGGDGEDIRHAAAALFNAACLYLDGEKSPLAHGVKPSDVLIAFCVSDDSYTAIGQRFFYKGDDYAKSYICKQLERLAEHYKDVDRVSGRSSTAATREAALQRFDPKD